MKDWFAEFLVVLSYSKRTQWAILLGVLGFFAIKLWGDYQLSNFVSLATWSPSEQ